MPTWLLLLLILSGIIVIMLVLICVVKFNKKIDSKVDIPDKASVALKIENDTPLPPKGVISLQNVEEQYGFIKNYVLSMIESHFLLSTVFYGMQNREDLSDKIYLKYILTKTDASEEIFEYLNKDVYIIQTLVKIYIRKIQEKIEKSFKFVEDNLDDVDSIYNLVTEICSQFENDVFLTKAIAEFKTEGLKVDLLDGKQFTISPDKMDDDILQRFKNKVKTSSVSFISEIRLTKTRLLSVDNKIVRVLSVMHCINNLCDIITKHIYTVYFECKPAVIGNSEGV